MLVSAVLKLSLKSQESPLGVSGQEVHGWFLDTIRRHNEHLSAELHKSVGHKPFTLLSAGKVDPVRENRFQCL